MSNEFDDTLHKYPRCPFFGSYVVIVYHVCVGAVLLLRHKGGQDVKREKFIC